MGVQAAEFPPSSLEFWTYDNAGRLTVSSTEKRTFDAENHTLTNQVYSGSANVIYNAVNWGPNGHPSLIGGSKSGAPTQFDTLHWDGGTLLFTTNGAGKVDDIKVGTMGDILPLDPGYAGLTFYDRDPSGGVMGCHNSTGATFVGITEVYSRAISNSKISGTWAVSPCTTYSSEARLTGDPVMPTSIMWWSSPTTISAANNVEFLTFPAPPIGQGGVLGMPRTDGYADGTDVIQGVRTYDSNAGTWTTPDAYAGDVDDPASQKAYMWNGNNPESYSDPEGLVAGWTGSSSDQKKEQRAYQQEIEWLNFIGDDAGVNMMESILTDKNFVVNITMQTQYDDYVDSSKGGKQTSAGETYSAHLNKGARIVGTLQWNPRLGLLYRGVNGSLGYESPRIGFLHEIAHAYEAAYYPARYSRDRNTPVFGYGDAEEERVIRGPEADALRAVGQPERANHYEGQFVCGLSSCW